MDSDDSAVSRRGFLRVAAGAGAASGVVGAAAAQEETPTTTPDGNTTATTASNETATPGSEETATPGGGGGGSEEVIVGPGGNLVYEPEDLQVTPGTTVNFVWDSDGHNVVPDSQPEGADWDGTGDASQLFDTGYEYSHTFETLGTYEYVCTPHASAGMVGTIEVVESISTPAPASGPPEIPDSAKTLGIAATIGMASTLGLAYFLMRFGGDYEES
jgi:plastocyanin